MKSKVFLNTRYEFIVGCLLSDKSLEQTAGLLTAQGLKITGRGLSYWLTRRKARIESKIAKFTTPSDSRLFLLPALPILPALSAALGSSSALPAISNLASSKPLPLN